MYERLNMPPIATPKTKETPPAFHGKQGVSRVLKAHQPRAIGVFRSNVFDEPDLAKAKKEDF